MPREEGGRRGRFAALTLSLVLSLGLAWPTAPTIAQAPGRAVVEPAAPAPAEALRERPAHVRIVASDGDGPEELTVRFTPEGAEEDGVRSRRVRPIEGVAEVFLSPPAGRNGVIEITAPGYWSAPVPVDPSSAAPASEAKVRTVHRVTLWPAAELRALLQTPDDRDRPRELTVRLAPASALSPSDRSQPPDGAEVTCPVDGFEIPPCTVPSGRWNVRLLAEPFAPHFLWDRSVRAEETFDLGTVKLHRGGSVFGELLTAGGPVDPERARVQLRSLSVGDGDDPNEEARRRQLARQGRVRPDGTFQVVGVTPGVYEIEATHPGFVHGLRSPLRVREGEWTELDRPIVLERPVRLALQVEPAAEPWGGAWTLNLYRNAPAGRFEQAGHGQTDPTGFWESPPLPAGSYVVEIRDGEDNTLLWRDVEVDRSTPLVRLEIPLVYVRGEVVLGGEPLEATVWFGGRTSAESVETASDEAGELFAVLPRDGTWTVDLRSEAPPVRSRGLEVEVDAPEGEHVAEVVIEVPDTRVTGEVVDTEGRPPRSMATVVLVSAEAMARTTGTEAGPDGRFELRGPSPGSYRIGAEADEDQSDVVMIQVSEDIESSVRLVLRGNAAIEGRVVSASGPIPGARVMAFPLMGTGRLGAMKLDHDRTGVDGGFAVSIPDHARSARLVTMALGYTLGVTTVAERDGIEVVLEAGGGTLLLEGVGEHTRTMEGTQFGLVTIDGEAVPLVDLREWSRLHGESPSERGDLVVPAMPAGEYALCRLSLREVILVLEGLALPSGRSCSGGFLPPGGSLRLADPG